MLIIIGFILEIIGIILFNFKPITLRSTRGILSERTKYPNNLKPRLFIIGGLTLHLISYSIRYFHL